MNFSQTVFISYITAIFDLDFFFCYTGNLMKEGKNSLYSRNNSE
jgi:hypothetical protein